MGEKSFCLYFDGCPMMPLKCIENYPLGPLNTPFAQCHGAQISVSPRFPVPEVFRKMPLSINRAVLPISVRQRLQIIKPNKCHRLHLHQDHGIFVPHIRGRSNQHIAGSLSFSSINIPTQKMCGRLCLNAMQIFTQYEGSFRFQSMNSSPFPQARTTGLEHQWHNRI